MRGVPEPEGDKFLRFFKLVQEAAKEQGGIFFLETGDGHDFENNEMEGEDLFGWLVPEAEADEFEAIWKKNPHDLDALEAWEDVLGFAEWEMVDGKIKIQFKFYDKFYD